MALKLLSLSKGGEAPKLRLNLSKESRPFTVELFWETPHDLDAHALEAFNNGNGARITSLKQVLSTYAFKRTVRGKVEGEFDRNTDGSFQTASGALLHNGDVLTGKPEGVDEIITINGSKLDGANEVPIFITIHSEPGARIITFSEVEKAGMHIKDGSGKTLAEYELSKQFGEFNIVQMGSLMLHNNGWEYVEVASGFMGDFNDILGAFS